MNQSLSQPSAILLAELHHCCFCGNEKYGEIISAMD